MKSKLNVLIAAAVWTGLGVSGGALATADHEPEAVHDVEQLPRLAKRKAKAERGKEAAKPAKSKMKKPAGTAKGKGKAPKAGPAKGAKGKDKEKADKGKKDKGKDKDKERGKSAGKGKGKKLGHLDTADKEAAHHARRLAQINRIEQLAKKKGDDALLEKVKKLRELEDSRHGKSLARIERKADDKAALNKAAEDKAAKTKAKNAKKAKKNAKAKKAKGKKGAK